MFFQIDGHVIRHMTDEELAKFIPPTGHRILVRQFVKNEAKQTEKPNQSERKRHLMDRIKTRLKQKENRNITLGVGKKSKPDRPIEFGLCMYVDSSYKQIRKSEAGGTRYTRYSKTCTKAILIKEACQLYEINPEEYICDMSTDVSGNCILSSEETVEEAYSRLKLKTIRFYLLCKKLDYTEESDLPDISYIVHNILGNDRPDFAVDSSTSHADMQTPVTSGVCAVMTDSHVNTTANSTLTINGNLENLDQTSQPVVGSIVPMTSASDEVMRQPVVGSIVTMISPASDEVMRQPVVGSIISMISPPSGEVMRQPVVGSIISMISPPSGEVMRQPVVGSIAPITSASDEVMRQPVVGSIVTMISPASGEVMRHPVVGSIAPITSPASGDVMRQPVVGNIAPITSPASGDIMSTDLQNVISSQTNSIVSGCQTHMRLILWYLLRWALQPFGGRLKMNSPRTSLTLFFEITCKAEENQTDSKNIINVTRDNVLDGALRAVTRATFPPQINYLCASQESLE